MTAVFPLIATDQPKWARAAASDAISLNSSLPVLTSNTYAEPDLTPLSSFSFAPMTTVLPLAATDWPNLSPAAPSDAVSLCASLYVMP